MDQPSASSSLLTLSTQRKLKGRVLKQIDADLQILGSGSLGVKRLILNIAIDFQESDPALSWDDAGRMAYGYFKRVYGDNPSEGGVRQ